MKNQKTSVPVKKTGKVKTAKEQKVRGVKSEIPIHRSIMMRLIGGFLVPVLGVLVLGVISYQSASNAIVNTYKDSVQQTTETIQQYVSLVVSSEKDEFKTYLSDDDMKKYFGGMLDEAEQLTTFSTLQSTLGKKPGYGSEAAFDLFSGGQTAVHQRVQPVVNQR